MGGRRTRLREQAESDGSPAAATEAAEACNAARWMMGHGYLLLLAASARARIGAISRRSSRFRQWPTSNRRIRW